LSSPFAFLIKTTDHTQLLGWSVYVCVLRFGSLIGLLSLWETILTHVLELWQWPWTFWTQKHSLIGVPRDHHVCRIYWA